MMQSSVSPKYRRGAHAGPPLPPVALLSFVVAALAVLFIALFSYRSLTSTTTTAERVTHTQEVLGELEELMSTLKDAETGQRGYLLTGEEPYLEPYTDASAALTAQFDALRDLTADNTEQRPRIDAIEQLATERMDIAARTIEMRRAGDSSGALALVLSDRGKVLMDRIRALVAEMDADERRLFDSRQIDWQDATSFSVYFTLGGSALLLILIGTAAGMTSGDYRARQTQSWLRTGQMGMGERLQGEQRLDTLGGIVLTFLAEYLDAQVGAIYIADGADKFRRFASYALPPGQDGALVRPGEGLLGQAAKENRPLHVVNVPASYLPVASSVGRGDPTELLVAPASVDGAVQAVLELGFFRSLNTADLELLARLSESIGIAVRASKDRTRLEELLEETQRQGEELQTQQEELRVNNEELVEQSRALQESQARLEAQQAELEQTNLQLSEQALLLDHQKDELSRAQVVLTDRAAELDRSNQYKSEFLANMSHELRTPLNSTLILATLLADNKEGNLTGEQVKFAKTIASAGNELLALINDILDLSKIEAGKVTIAPESVQLSRTVDALIQSFAPIAREKKLQLRAAFEPDAPARIETDVQRLGQILKNLLSNALKFTDKGEVSLRVFRGTGDTVSFTVRDSGIGIPADQQELIFEAFRQADGSTHRRHGGTGLGLSISRDLARLLGGQISLLSTPGEGSAFTLTLPLVYAEPSEAAPPRAAAVGAPAASLPATPGAHAATDRSHAQTWTLPASPAGSTLAASSVEDDREHLTPGSRVILVVEDDARFAAILRDLAHDMGFQCVITHSAGDGLLAAATYRPNAILLDINLPDHSGLGVLDQLKRNPQTRHIPVHVASVEDFSREALALGAIGYALKPVKREELIEAFKRLEMKFSQTLRHVLVVEDDEVQQEGIRQLLANDGVQVTGVTNAGAALALLQSTTFDCMVMDLNLPDLSGYELLEKMAVQDGVSFPPVIVYTARSILRDDEQRLRRYSKSIIIKDARSPERLLDEVTLFLHQVEASLPLERQRMLQTARNRETSMEGRCVLVVEDDVRNVFALTSLLGPKGIKVEIARNGREAIEALTRSSLAGATAIDLVLMDIMMPEMDGLTAMREIRKRPEWKRLPIIALTAKAMKDDQDKCLAAGANDYIAKPLDVEKLLSLVRVWMPK